MVKASIVVATYNRKDKLKRCLTALAKQNYPKKNYEIIIVDDGSTDGTYEYLLQQKTEIKNLRVFRQKNKGPASARNLGVKKAKGEIIFFTDDDVIVPKNWIKKFLKVLDAYPDVAGVGGSLEAHSLIIKKNIFAKYEKYMSEISYKKPKRIYIGGFETFGVVTCNAAYRKKVLEEVGGFDESFPVAAGEDADLKLRVVLRGYKLAYVPIRAIHIQDYNLKRFWNQQVARGIGEKYFINKWKDLLKNSNKRKETNTKPNISIPLKIIKDKEIKIFCLFILSIIASKYGKIFKKK